MGHNATQLRPTRAPHDASRGGYRPAHTPRPPHTPATHHIEYFKHAQLPAFYTLPSAAAYEVTYVLEVSYWAVPVGLSTRFYVWDPICIVYEEDIQRENRMSKLLNRLFTLPLMKPNPPSGPPAVTGRGRGGGRSRGSYRGPPRDFWGSIHHGAHRRGARCVWFRRECRSNWAPKASIGA